MAARWVSGAKQWCTSKLWKQHSLPLKPINQPNPLIVQTSSLVFMCFFIHFVSLLLCHLEQKHGVIWCWWVVWLSCFLLYRHTAPSKRSWCHLDGGLWATRSTDTLDCSLQHYVTQLRFFSQVSVCSSNTHYHSDLWPLQTGCNPAAFATCPLVCSICDLCGFCTKTNSFS